MKNGGCSLAPLGTFEDKVPADVRQLVARCPSCQVALWSHYAGAGPLVSFVRVGTLDEPDRLPPDVHIFTASKQPWVQLPAGTPAVPMPPKIQIIITVNCCPRLRSTPKNCARL